MWASLAAVAAVGGSIASIVSIVERFPSVLAWRLAKSLRVTRFRASRGSRFSDLSRLLANGERPFSRAPLEQQLVARIRASIGAGQTCLIVGGPGGIGKSVLWEALLAKRPEAETKDGVWSGLAGPTRVINLLKCASLDDFRRQVVAAFSSEPFLPRLGLSPSPTYESVLEVLEAALRELPTTTPLIVFVEDVNSMVKFPGWELAFLQLSTAVASSGNGIIVGNSSTLLAYMNFESLSHTGLRTDAFFFPTISTGSKELKQFAQDGGHLFAPGHPQPSPPKKSLVPQLNLWNGNVQLIKHGTARTVDAVRTRLAQSLEGLALVNKPQWSHLVTPACIESAASVLHLRAALLALLSKAPGHEVPILELPRAMRVFLVAEQLAAADLVTFRTRSDLAGDGEYDVVAPYHPVVVELFKQYVVSAIPMQQVKPAPVE